MLCGLLRDTVPAKVYPQGAFVSEGLQYYSLVPEVYNNARPWNLEGRVIIKKSRRLLGYSSTWVGLLN